MKSILQEKSIAFSIRIINLKKFLVSDKKEFDMSRQLLRSGTAIGALLMEGEFAQSKKDFINKFHIAIKEANETRYWLLLLSKTDYISKDEFESMKGDCEELIKMLASSIKTAKANVAK